MTELSLDAMRHAGMKLLAALMGVMALATVAGTFFTDVNNEGVALFLALALPAWPVWLALNGRTDAPARMAVTMTMVAQPAVMLFVFQGQPWQVDLHMLFFAALATTAMLCDWRALVAGAGVVALHHLGLGMLVPDWVFLGGGGIGRILLHAVILIAETGALVFLAARMAGLIDALNAGARQRAEIEAQTAAERARHEAELTATLETVSASLAALAKGDLSTGLAGRLPAAYAALEADFTLAIDSLSKLIGSVGQGAEAIQLASTEIAAASEDLARRTESAAHTLEQTSEAIGLMDRRLKAIALSADGVVARADEAIVTVRESRSVSDEVVVAMGRVSDSARGIDDVIEGLDKIAFQTRVLAMNAAVEAGRAGEAGRGFAVVADLVSALAMRAEEEAKRAREQLTVTQGDIHNAVGAVEKVDGALGSISEHVEQVHKLLGAMAEDNQTQADAIGRISAAVSTMEASTTQNAAMVEETSATARKLSDEVESLADSAARFQIAEAAAVPARRAPARASLH
ncbi:methyl-accepting chemotaxis protein [Sphingomonas sp. R-74633]|uniref:methyl-accepting chemotaxis protein n=1 Tax=Sphingomonas sp. R-74633 TaxID=2751188 RepID=UPI0015D2AA17|nr:methyl-accepting chemotaxis protein [Sphingomonas sp. R-74633]NYT42676.1 methyl-accepting chemotaxis protein [Sphingomonas sp. R-74633]